VDGSYVPFQLASSFPIPPLIKTALTVSPESVVSWNPLSGPDSANSVTTDQLHVYYTGLDLGIYEFLGSNVSTKIPPGRRSQDGITFGPRRIMLELILLLLGTCFLFSPSDFCWGVEHGAMCANE
jgi:hypothetical protein